MKKLFDADGKLLTLVGIVGDHFMLSLLWLVVSLPIITVGAASAAACQLSFQIQEGQECRLIRDFFSAVKQYFKTATKLWLAILAICLVFMLDMWFYLQLAGQYGSFAAIVLGMIGLFALVFALCLVWIYPYMTRYGSGFSKTVKMSFLLGVMNLGWTALILALDVAVVLLSLFASFLIPFVPGLITLINTALLRIALRKYHKAQSSAES